MKSNVLLRFAGVLLLAGLVVTLAGCNGDPAGPTPTPAATEDAAIVVVDAVEGQQFCPVMDGMPVDRSLYVDHDGQRVYFCCAGCIPAFEQDPERYMDKLHAAHADPETHDDHDQDPDHDYADDHDHDHDDDDYDDDDEHDHHH